MKILNELADLANKANCAGQGTREMVEFRVVANPDNILAIAEAFRALEQRAEAAEAKLAAKPSYFLNRIESSDKWGPEVELRLYENHLDAMKSQGDHGGGVIELFTRPAPAVSLAELVPEPFKVFRQAGGVMVAVRDSRTKNHLYGIGYNACIAEIINRIINSGELTRPEHESDEARLCAILRNIGEAK